MTSSRREQVLRHGGRPSDTPEVIVVALFGLGLLTVPLTGGRLGRLADLRLRRWGVLLVAFVLQLVALKGGLPHNVAAGLNLSTYALGIWYLAANLHIPGMWLVGLGTATNVLAIVANQGIMPTTEEALATAGLSSGNGATFVNSAVLPDARIEFFGDIFAVPKGLPLHNVFSVGDILIILGALVAVHRICRSRLLPRTGGDFEMLRRNRSFMSLWVAQGVSSIGDWVYTIAVAASLAGRDADPSVFATLLIVQVAPAALMGALGGPLVDRLPRKTVMICGDLFRGLAVASLFLVGTPSIPHLYIVAGLLGLLGALAQPALQASLPNVVPPKQLVAANALVSATFNGAVMIGPVIGGVLVARLGFGPAIFINGVSFLVSAAMVARVFLPPQPPCDEKWHPVRELREGFRYMSRTPLVRAAIVVMGLVMLAAAIKSPVEPLFVLRVLHGEPATLGFLGGAWGVGMVLGSILAPSAARALPREQLLWGGIGTVGVSVVAASQAESLGPVIVLWLLAGMGNALGTVCYESLLQERTPDEVRGRVLSASEAVLDAAFLGGVGLAAWLGSELGPRGAITAAGTVFLLAALLSRVLLERRMPAFASVPVLDVDEADELLALAEAADVLADAGAEEGPGHLGGVGGVRGDEAVGEVPERVLVGQWFGLGDVEGGPADPLFSQGGDEVIGDHVLAASHVHQPGVGLHHSQLRRRHDALRLRRERQGQYDEVGASQGVVQAVDGEGACPTCEWLGLATDDCCIDPERGQQAQQRRRDAARAHDGDAGAEEAAAGGRAPGAGDRALVEVP
jgi:MFS family permease